MRHLQLFLGGGAKTPSGALDSAPSVKKSHATELLRRQVERERNKITLTHSERLLETAVVSDVFSLRLSPIQLSTVT